MDTGLSDNDRSSELDQSSDQADNTEEGPERKRMRVDPDVSSDNDDPLAKLLESPTSEKSR